MWHPLTMLKVNFARMRTVSKESVVFNAHGSVKALGFFAGRFDDSVTADALRIEYAHEVIECGSRFWERVAASAEAPSASSNGPHKPLGVEVQIVKVETPEEIKRYGVRATPDDTYSKIILVTLPEVTPVSQAAALPEDLRRAGIEPYACVLNKSVLAASTRDPLLAARLAGEHKQMDRISGLAKRIFALAWLAVPPIGFAELSKLVSKPSIAATIHA